MIAGFVTLRLWRITRFRFGGIPYQVTPVFVPKPLEPHGNRTEVRISKCGRVTSPAHYPGGATAASGWFERLSASATKPEAFNSSMKARR